MSYERLNLSPDKKIAGVLVPLFALRGMDDLGIGDVDVLREFIDWGGYCQGDQDDCRRHKLQFPF
jgi:hypothetical protein